MPALSTQQIFIHDCTFIDISYLNAEDDSSIPLGKSYAVAVYWKGELDKLGMVFDFSFAKKQAKELIDKSFDHKLFVNSENVEFYTTSDSNEQRAQVVRKNSEGEVTFLLDSPAEGIKCISSQSLKELAQGRTLALEKEIAEEVMRGSPKNVKNIKVVLSNHSSFPSGQGQFFNYTHCICQHGGNCQRFHGHSSYVAVKSNQNTFFSRRRDKAQAQVFAKALNGKFLINQAFQKTEKEIRHQLEFIRKISHEKNSVTSHFTFSKGTLFFHYQSTQGQFFIAIPEEKTILTSGESTVENFAKMLYSNAQNKVGNKNILVSVYEGLKKGAFYP